MLSVETQLSIYLDNRPGTLARTCQALSKEQINIVALSILDTVDHAVIRMVTSDVRKAVKVLQGLHATVQEREVIFMDLSNKPGMLATIAQKLAEAGINLEYAYCTSPSSDQDGKLVLRTNDIEATIDVLS